VIIDGGNSYFADTERRVKELQEAGLHFIGMGVSGGETGALWGPSMMPGGSAVAWERVAPMFRAIAAKAEDGEPCVAWMGNGGAGHYIKMVHNGIEYGDMQLIAEIYDLRTTAACPTLRWPKSLLMEYARTALVLIESAKIDEWTDTGQPLVDVTSTRRLRKVRANGPVRRPWMSAPLFPPSTLQWKAACCQPLSPSVSSLPRFWGVQASLPETKKR
jgi:6-phosphogluconate dehydrogenase